MTTTMNAILFDEFGPASVLRQGQVERPRANAGEVLVRLSHTSVNPVDWKIREGYLKGALPHRLPIIPGWDAAGTVAELGAGVTGFATGDEVFAYARLPEVHSGTYAEYIALPATTVARKPARLSLAEAAAVPLVGLTAFQALHEFAAIRKGDKILVTAGAGGVGSFAIQIAKAAGAEVTATAGTANQIYLKELGADHAIDYTRGSVTDAARRIAPGGFDVVFDAVGGASLKEAATLVRDGGRLVSIVDTPDAKELGARGVKSGYHFVYPSGAQLATLGRMIEDGTVVPPTTQVRSVKDAAAAQVENQARHVRGKVVLAIDF